MDVEENLMDLFGTRLFLEARNEFRAALQCGAREVGFAPSGPADGAIRLLAAASNGVPVSLGNEQLPGLRKGTLRASLGWCRLFVNAEAGAPFAGTLIVRENGTAMFARTLPGLPAQAALDVVEDVFNAAGDGLRGEHALELDRLAAALLLNPWAVTRVPAEGQVEFHAAHPVPDGPGGNGPGRLPNGAATADLLLRPVTVSVVAPDPAEVKRAKDILEGLVDFYQRTSASHEQYYAMLQEAGRTDVGDVALEWALDGLPGERQRWFGQLVDALIDEGFEWEGFLPRPKPDWTYRGDWVVKWMKGRGAGLDPMLPKYQRLLRAWQYIVREMAGLLELRGWAFTPGLLVGDEDYTAELSEWGGRAFILLNPRGIRVSAPLEGIVLALRDRAAHVVAHAGCPSHDERWARRHEFLLEETAGKLLEWKRQLHWLSSYGASVAAKNGG